MSESGSFEFGINALEDIGPHHEYGADSKAEHVPIAPEIIGNIGSFPLTNTLLDSFLITLLLSICAVVLSRKITAVPDNFQALMEIVVENIFKITEQLAGTKVHAFFPWVMTYFLYILAANLVGLLPGVSTIGFHQFQNGETVFVPIFRPINSDLNMTLGLALLSVLVTHFFSIYYLGFKGYLKRWFSLKMFGIMFFVGILELIAEFTKMLSLSLRLFGNILSGKVLMKTAASFSAFFLPLPFYFLELVVSVVQAVVFMMLTLVFMVILSNKNHD